MLLDKNTKQMLRYISDPENSNIALFQLNDFIEKYQAYSNLTDHQIRACLRFLEKNQFIRFASSGKSGIVIAFELEHKSYYWEEFQLIDLIRYIQDKWIDLAALIISIIAVTLSIIALSRTEPRQVQIKPDSIYEMSSHSSILEQSNDV